jgi:hypothetical protein
MRSSSVISAAGLCFAVVVEAPRVHAFCRTTTSAVPGGYDHTVHGCWTKGTPLAWHISRVPIGVISRGSSQVSLADATRELDLTLAAWNHVSCSGQSPSIQAYDDGPIARVPQGGCTRDSCDPAANDYVVFDDSDWPYDDPANPLALTTVTYRIDDGRILAAHVEINTAQHQIVAEEPPPPGAYDLQAILTHETGHFFGLADSNDPAALMSVPYRAGAIGLTPDDEDGLCSIYPPASSPSGGRTVTASCAVQPLRADDEPPCVVGFALAIIGAIVARGRTKA